MKLTQKSRMLLVVAGLLLALNLLFGRPSSNLSESPRIQAVTREAVTRIEISGAEDKLVIRPEAGRWRVTAPYQAEADQQAVQNILTSFRKEVPVDVQVDRGNEDRYGLEPGKGVVVEIWTDGEEPVISFTVGDDAAGGSTYVRLSGDDAVYRARLGGRARFARPQGEWRSRYVLDLPPEKVVGLEIQAGEAELSLTRPAADPASPANARPWSLEPAPPWPLDQALLDALGGRLAQLRSTAILPPDTALGALSTELRLSLDDGTTRTLRLYAREDGPLLATVDEQPERYRVPEVLLQLLPRSPEDLRDRTVLRLARADIDTLLLEDAQGQVLVRQDPATQVWTPIQPAELQLDVKQTQVAGNILALLRAESVVEGGSGGPETGLAKPTLKLTITHVDGAIDQLLVGAPTTDARGQPAWYAAREGGADAYVISDELIRRLKAGFGRS